jgi:hypothetical protein
VTEDSLVIVDNITGHVVVVNTINEVVVAGGGVSVLTFVVSSVFVIGITVILVRTIVEVCVTGITVVVDCFVMV